MSEHEDQVEPIATGQRVARETRFEASDSQVGRIRFTHPVQGALPLDEHAFPSSETGVSAEASAVIYTTELADSPSVWEARAGEEKPD